MPVTLLQYTDQKSERERYDPVHESPHPHVLFHPTFDSLITLSLDTEGRRAGKKSPDSLLIGELVAYFDAQSFTVLYICP